MWSSTRTTILWAIFIITATAAGAVMYRLYATAKSEIAAQTERVLAEERTNNLERARSFIDDVKLSTLTDLIGFHDDGLQASLRQWDEANQIVLATFIWDTKRGFVMEGQPTRGAIAQEEIKKLWTEFRRWRQRNAGSKTYTSEAIDGFAADCRATLDSSWFRGSELGFQAENLEILAHAGGKPDPWAGWALSKSDAKAPWIFWYQAAADAPVRGALLDGNMIEEQLGHELDGGELVRVRVVSAEPSPALPGQLVHTGGRQIPGFPALRLVVEPGEIFSHKQEGLRLTGFTAIIVFSAFLAVGVALTAYTRFRAQDAERKISFVSQVSHELRTPLTSIRMYADLLAQSQLAEEKRIKFGTTIAAESARLAGLIDRLLTFSTLVSVAKTIAVTPIDVSQCVSHVVSERSEALERGGIECHLTLESEPCFALSDESTIKQSLINLFDNAIKYAASGKQMVVTVAKVEGRVLIDVIDNGAGVPKKLQQRIFEPFFQAGETLTDKPTGVGLGLSIARGLLRQTGGELILINGERGAHFQIQLPSARADRR